MYSFKCMCSRLAATVSKKTLIALLALVMLLASAAGGTVAWLQAGTREVKNTFTAGNVSIDLTETDTELDEDDDLRTNDYQMDIGAVIAKDPTVHVNAYSLDCWLFVRVDESENFADFMEYAIADGWTPMEGTAGLYCRPVDSKEEIQSFSVLLDDQVKVKDTVTYESLAALTPADYPTLTFTAYAVQRNEQVDATATPEAAWQVLLGVQ